MKQNEITSALGKISEMIPSMQNIMGNVLIKNKKAGIIKRR